MTVVLLAAVIGVEYAWAQTSVCVGQPWLGTNGPEVCVEIRDEGTGRTYTERFPNASQPGPTYNINQTVGQWRADLTFELIIGPTGMAMEITGEAWRSDPGSGWLNVRADGGTNVAMHVDHGSLWLDGTATAASGTVLGGAYGIRRPGGDVEFIGFPRVVEETTYGPGAFHGEIDEMPIDADAVAVSNITGFHVNEDGDLIEIPSGVVVGDPPPPGDAQRRWRSTNLTSDHIPMESRVAPLTAGANPGLVVANVSWGDLDNYLNAFRIDPPYGPADVIEDGVLDSGFLYGVHKICVPEPGHAVVPYMKGDGPNIGVWVADYEDGAWRTSPVEATAVDDYHSATCFTTAHGLYLKTLNFTDQTVELFRRSASGRWDPWMTLTAAELGGNPESPALGAAIGKAGDLPTFGVGGIGDAIFTVGMEDGTLTVGQIRTAVPELVGIWNAGPANGETSADISYDEVRACHKASVNWMNQSEFNHATWCVEDGLGGPHKIKIGTIEPGTLISEFQGVSGAGARDGTYIALADKAYEIDASDNVKEHPSYSFRTMGGPTDLVLVEDPLIRGFAAGPGSQRLGILSHVEPVAGIAVPALARVRGAGAFFTSVMHLFNAGVSAIEFEMTFTPRSGSGGAVTTVNHTLPAGVMQTIEDPLQTIFGFGGSAGRVGSVLITVTSGPATDLMVQTVVFAQLDSGEEYGQFFPAMRVGDAVPGGRTVYLNTTEDPEHNRVNIGLMAVADLTRFKVTPVDPLGNGVAAPKTFDLNAGGNTQINNVHTTFGLGTTPNVVIEVEVLAGRGFAYASVLDGSGSYAGTSDPTTILPTRGGSEQVTLLEIGSIQGLNEFSGSASITNYSNRSAAVRAFFFQRDHAGVSAAQDLTIAAGKTRGFSDLGSELFGVSGDVGTVVLSTTNNTLIGATGREFAIFRDGHGDVVGTAGQLIAGQTDGDRLAPGSTYHFIGLRQVGGGGAVERSHFAVYNPGWADADVTVRLYDGDTGGFEGELSWVIGGRTLVQVNNVIRTINPSQDGTEKRIEIEVDRPVFINAFRVNPWGDPITLSPFKD